MLLIEFEEKYKCVRMSNEEPKYFSGKEIKEDILSISIKNPGFSLRVGTFIRMSDVPYTDYAFIKLRELVCDLDDDTKYCLTYYHNDDIFSVTQEIFNDKDYKWYEHINAELIEDNLIQVKWSVPCAINTNYYDALIYTYGDPFQLYYSGSQASEEIESYVFEYLKKEFPTRF